jgi:hypothetical protein
VTATEHTLDLGEVRRKYDYDPMTGEFRWKISVRSFGGKTKIGSVAGSVNDQGYVLLNVNRRNERAHRIAWQLTNGPIPDGYEIDHENGVRNDNRISNLFLKTRSGNTLNRRLLDTNCSGYPGVSRVVRKNGMVRWDSRITINYKVITLGVYDSLDEAIQVRQRAERDLLGFDRAVSDVRGKAA